VRRLIQPVGIVFKGSGFYITDQRQLSSATSPAPKAISPPKDAEEKKALPAAESSKPTKTQAAESTKPAKTEAAD